MNVIERFLNYVAVDTESVEDAACFPSSEKQKNLAKMLVEELKEIGAENPRMDEFGYVYATIPATSDKKVPVLGFLAHMDTSPAMSGANVKPRIVKNYDGGKIVLNEAENIAMDADMFPSLAHNVGKDLIVTDGTTLLGADDKAGIAEIMTMTEILLTNKSIPHGTIQIAFTPDEEVGAGVKQMAIGPCLISGFASKVSAIVIISATPALSSAPRSVVPSVVISVFPIYSFNSGNFFVVNLIPNSSFSKISCP